MKSELHQIYEKLKTDGVVNLHIATVSLKTKALVLCATLWNVQQGTPPSIPISATGLGR